MLSAHLQPIFDLVKARMNTGQSGWHCVLVNDANIDFEISVRQWVHNYGDSFDPPEVSEVIEVAFNNHSTDLSEADIETLEMELNGNS